MAENSTGRQRATRRERVPLSKLPYRPSKKGPFAVYSVVVLILMVVVIVSVTQARFSWLWVFPFLATAATVYCYRRERVAKNMVQGTLWVFAQTACGLGAIVLIVLPAKY